MDTATFFNETLPGLIEDRPQLRNGVLGVFEFNVEGAGVWTLSLSGRASVRPGPANGRHYTLNVSSADFEQVVDEPTKAWSMFLDGRVRTDNGCLAAQMWRRLFPDALETALGDLFAGFFPALSHEKASKALPEDPGATPSPAVEHFLAITVPERHGATPGYDQPGRLGLSVEGVGVWTIDPAVDPLVSRAAAGPLKSTISLSQSDLERLIEDSSLLWEMLLDRRVRVTNACRAARFSNIVFPGGLERAMPSALYTSLVGAPVSASPSDCEYGGSGDVGTTYALGRNGPFPIKYEAQGEFALYQGDIVLGTVSAMKQVAEYVESHELGGKQLKPSITKPSRDFRSGTRPTRRSTCGLRTPCPTSSIRVARTRAT